MPESVRSSFEVVSAPSFSSSFHYFVVDDGSKQPSLISYPQTRHVLLFLATCAILTTSYSVKLSTSVLLLLLLLLLVVVVSMISTYGILLLLLLLLLLLCLRCSIRNVVVLKKISQTSSKFIKTEKDLIYHQK